MRIALKLQESLRTRIGSACQYKVLGMPPGQELLINNFGAPYRDDWRTMHAQSNGTDTGWRGRHVSAAEALADFEMRI
jgi:hypothetical protein